MQLVELHEISQAVEKGYKQIM